MERPAARTSQGFLLVEAVLAAAVIAVGLVFITRGLSGQLRALQSIEHHERLLALAHRKLLELEIARTLGRSVSLEDRGRFPEPDTDVVWSISAIRRPSEGDGARPPLSDIHLVVEHAEAPSTVLHLTAVWHADDVPESWF